MTNTLYFKTERRERREREREERETMASAAAAAAPAAVDIEDEDQKRRRRRRKRRSLRRESKIIGQIDIEIESNSSQRYKQEQYLSIELTNKNYDDAAEMCVNFCEERGLPMKIAPALALRLRAAYKKALIKQAMDDSLNSSSVGGFEREREHAKTEGEEDKEEEYKGEEVRREKVQLLTSNPADMARRIAEIKKKNTFNKDDETTTATKANTTSKSFQMVTPSNVGSWNPVASGEMTMQKIGADATRVVRREREREREEEEINGGGDLLEVIVVDEQQQQEQQRSHGGQFEFEEECASEADLEEEMLEFEITPTKQDYADSFARPSDWFVQDFEDKATLSAKKTNETFKTPSKKESDRGEGSRGSGAAVAAVVAAVVDGDDDSDTSLSEKIIHASPGFKNSLKMFEAMDASPKKKSSFVKSPTMTAPGFVSPMETKKPNPRYAPRDLNE